MSGIASIVLRLLLPRAYAAGIDNLGANSPGVSTMWSNIRQIFPFSTTDTHLPTVIASRVFTLVSGVIGIAAVIGIVYAGIQVSIAGGDDGKLSQAKTTIMYALVGVVITLLTNVIMMFMCGTLLPMIFQGNGQCQVL